MLVYLVLLKSTLILPLHKIRRIHLQAEGGGGGGGGARQKNLQQKSLMIKNHINLFMNIVDYV